MMFFYREIENVESGKIETHIYEIVNDSYMRTFPATDDNPNMVAYLAWVADGNTAEEWKPETTTESVEP
jgi:hypothetical protein